jgi:glycosyltransferase involved in cell wall biosynthesis
MHGTLIMPRAPWPTHGGREVYSHHLLAAFEQLGHPTRAVFTEAPSTTGSSWPLASRIPIDSLDAVNGAYEAPRGRLDRRWRCYWGWTEEQLGTLRDLINHHRPTFVAAAGLQMLPALAAVPEGIHRIWLALDEPVSFQMSIGRSANALTEKLTRLKLAAIFAVYQRTYANDIDMAVAVSKADAKALRRVGGFKKVLCLPNGVDADFFAPQPIAPDPHTAVFWGRLDFRPNIQALQWFGRNVWPEVMRRSPKACLRIIGRQPDPACERELRALPGVEWIGPVDDVRPWACRSSVVVLPIQSGAGIKNKLLEAAAMARPIIASPMAVTGLHAPGAWQPADSPDEWIDQLLSLWAEPERGELIGKEARRWILRDHSWGTNARQLLEHVRRQRSERGIHETVLQLERRAA